MSENPKFSQQMSHNTRDKIPLHKKKRNSMNNYIGYN